jgi:hypothetical protein
MGSKVRASVSSTKYAVGGSGAKTPRSFVIRKRRASRRAQTTRESGGPGIGVQVSRAAS